MEQVTRFVLLSFIATVIITFILLMLALKSGYVQSRSKALAGVAIVLLVWLLIQALLGKSGWYSSNIDALPPRIVVAGVLPALVAVFVCVFGKMASSVTSSISLRLLTWVHVVRIPVELVLWQLYQQQAIPVDMTFEGSNFDILAGLTAPVVAIYCFRLDRINQKLLLSWNIIALGLLLNIIIISVRAAPSPFQAIAFEQPNKAVLYFPFVWLPTFVVPVVLFAHLLAIKRLLTNR